MGVASEPENAEISIASSRKLNAWQLEKHLEEEELALRIYSLH